MLTHTCSGNGLPIVFLHGFCESKSVWNEFISVFEPEYTVYCIDLPGFGDNAPVQDISINKMASAVVSTLSALHIKQAVFVGHSLGGYVSLAIAELFPEVVKGLCLFNSTSKADSEEKKESRDKTKAFVIQNGVKAFVVPFVPPLFHPKNRSICSHAIQQITEEAFHLQVPSVAATIDAMKNRPDRTHVLSTATYPICIIAGREDGAVPLENTLSFVSAPERSHILLLSECAHMAMYEAKEKSQKHLLDYFQLVCHK